MTVRITWRLLLAAVAAFVAGQFLGHLFMTWVLSR